MVERGPFLAGILDLNPKRMDKAELRSRSIPSQLAEWVGDQRQYALNIGHFIPQSVIWYDERQPWYFRSVLRDPVKVHRLLQNTAFILTGSGMSAYHYQQGDYGKLPEPTDARLLGQSEAIVRGELGRGKWILGICFGGQLADLAVSGKLGRLPEMPNGSTVTEAGWLEQELTQAGRKDEIFKYLPKRFSAPHLHSDYVAELPKVGTTIETANKPITVVRAEILAVRRGYLDSKGLKNQDKRYIAASVVVFNNGARLYQVQFHPEMSSDKKANFLVRQNPWIAKEMGEEYYQKALAVPRGANFIVASIIPQFFAAIREFERTKHQVTFANAMLAQNYARLLPYMLE